MDLIFTCIHCNNSIIINESDINCGIFRHAIMKNTYEQINPHASLELCNKLIENELIIGCGKPFRIIKKDSYYKIEICDYI